MIRHVSGRRNGPHRPVHTQAGRYPRVANVETNNTIYMKKILLLGSGELGKEFVIAAMRAGQYVIACDRYDNAPAMQVADEREVFSMLDGDALEAVVNKHKPDIIVPEIEAIRTERLFKFEE